MKTKFRIIVGAFLVSAVVSFSVYYLGTPSQTAIAPKTKVLIPVDSLSLQPSGLRNGELEQLPINDRIILRDIRDISNLDEEQWADKRHLKNRPLWKDPRDIGNGLDLGIEGAVRDRVPHVPVGTHLALAKGLEEKARANGWWVVNTQGGTGQQTEQRQPSQHFHRSRTPSPRVETDLPPESYGPVPPESDWRKGRCSDPLCSEYLSTADREHYRVCRNASETPPAVDDSPQCHFMDGRGRDPVGLVSFPGSGNTWVRGLLEKVTGVCTGAVYCDRALRYRGFVGEHIVSGSVVVVKSHVITYQWKGEKLEYLHYGEQSIPAVFGSAIFLVRNPFDVLVSERKRLLGLMEIGQTTWPPPPGKVDDSHTRNFNESFFGSNVEWEAYLHEHCIQWVQQIRKWVLHPISRGKTILVVRYEDLKTNKMAEVKKMLQFLHFTVDEQTLRDRLDQDYTTFQRQRDRFDHYTPSQRQYINRIVRNLHLELQRNGLDQMFRLDKYISES